MSSGGNRPGTGDRLSAGFGEAGFRRVRQGSAWVRNLADVLQVIIAETMRGGHLRLRVFVTAPSAQTVGGNLTRTSIEGRGTIGSDYFWSLAPESEAGSPVNDIMAVFRHTALPWFDTICSLERLVTACTLRPPVQYRLADDDLPPGEQVQRIPVRALPLRSAADIDALANRRLCPSLERQGFSRHGTEACFVRRRGDIFDIVELVPVNDAVHVACYAYNWIREFSVQDSGEFSTDARVAFVGGLVTLDRVGSPVRETAVLGDGDNAVTVLHALEMQLSGEIIPQLSAVTTKAEFVSAVDPVHLPTLRALGVVSQRDSQ